MKFLFLRTYMKREGRWQLLSMAQIFSVDPSTMLIDPPSEQYSSGAGRQQSNGTTN